MKKTIMVTTTNVGSIEENIKILENWLEELNELFKNTHINNTKERKALKYFLSDYKRVLKENEELKDKLLDTLKGQKVIKEETPQYIKENYIPKKRIENIIDRIDYDIKKTKEIISKNTNVQATYRKNDYQIVRLRAMNTKSLDIKKRLQKLLESEE